MTTKRGQQAEESPGSALSGPAVEPAFAKALDDLVAAAQEGQRQDSELFNPSDQWLRGHLRILQDLPDEERQRMLQDAQDLAKGIEEANAAGRAATRAWPDIAVGLDNGGVGRCGSRRNSADNGDAGDARPNRCKPSTSPSWRSTAPTAA